MQLRFFPGLAEGRQVLPRIAVQIELVRDDLVYLGRLALMGRKAVLREGMLKHDTARQRVIQARLEVFA
jgi:hypothetical protein